METPARAMQTGAWLYLVEDLHPAAELVADQEGGTLGLRRLSRCASSEPSRPPGMHLKSKKGGLGHQGSGAWGALSEHGQMYWGDLGGWSGSCGLSGRTRSCWLEMLQCAGLDLRR